ncbi:MAG TPA: VWA domain-containing protein [Kofleriaceae bacterium]|nr:VWA domain-containing protein [Kofleriaceae bacterium]
MTFAHPWALALAALCAPVVLAYLHKLHRERRTIASVILSRALRDERPASRRSRARLRHKLSLALVLAALAAALIALVGPRASSGRARRIVVVMDRSASMGTSDRLARAVDAVRDVADRAGDGDEVALIAAGGDPEVVTAPTRAHGDVVAAAEAVAQRGAEGDNRFDELAFHLADGLCRDSELGSIVVVSDGAGLAVPPTRCAVRGVSVGKPAENFGITGLSVRPLDSLGMYDVHVAVSSSATTDKKVEVTLTADGELVDVIALDVPLGGDAERTVRVTIDRGKTLVASLPGGDANPLDDRAEVELTEGGPVSVLLVTTRKASLVGEALKLHHRVELEVAAPDKLPAHAFDLIVLEDAPVGALPPGKHVVAFAVSPGNDAPIQLASDAAERKITRWDFDAPWFRYVDLKDVIVTKAKLVAGGKPIVDGSAGPLAASARWGDRELFVTGFQLDATDLALRASFPNLVANLVEWAGPAQASPARGVLASSETHVDPKPLPGGTAESASPWSDASWLARLVVLLAIALLVVEQALYLRKGELR